MKYSKIWSLFILEAAGTMRDILFQTIFEWLRKFSKLHGSKAREGSIAGSGRVQASLYPGLYDPTDSVVLEMSNKGMATESSEPLSRGMTSATGNCPLLQKQFPIYSRVLIETENMTVWHQVTAPRNVKSSKWQGELQSSHWSYDRNETSRMGPEKVQKTQVNLIRGAQIPTSLPSVSLYQSTPMASCDVPCDHAVEEEKIPSLF